MHWRSITWPYRNYLNHRIFLWVCSQIFWYDCRIMVTCEFAPINKIFSMEGQYHSVDYWRHIWDTFHLGSVVDFTISASPQTCFVCMGMVKGILVRVIQALEYFGMGKDFFFEFLIDFSILAYRAHLN